MTSAQKSDSAFDAVLRRALRAGSGAANSGCPDESVIAAYCDRSLPSPQIADLERHFSDCARCQATLAAIARAGTRAQPVRPTRLRLYGAVAAAAIGISVAAGILATRPKHPMLASVQTPSMERSKSKKAETDERQLLAMNEAVKGEPAKMARHIPERRARAFGFGTQSAPSQFAGAAPAAPESAARDYAAAPAPVAPGTASMLGGVQAQPKSALPMTVVPGVDGVVRWRIGTDGTIERLQPDGSWLGQNSGVRVNLRAGSAPSPQTCWVVGDAGTVLRTVDGLHWRRLTAPASIDLTAIAAIDASTATVTAANGQRFHTNDGGRTWRSAPY